MHQIKPKISVTNILSLPSISIFSKKERNESLRLPAYRLGNAVHGTGVFVRSVFVVSMPGSRIAKLCHTQKRFLFDVTLQTIMDGSRVERQKHILKPWAGVAMFSHFNLSSDMGGGFLGTGFPDTVY